MPVLLREQVRNLDRVAVERFGILGIVLMENAGRGATDHLLDALAPSSEDRILVVAGRGNNGGDGHVVARHLTNRGFPVELAILGTAAAFRDQGDAGVNFRIAERMKVPIIEAPSTERLAEALRSCTVAVDAILGTGLTGEVRGGARDAIFELNASGKPIFALDLPSGLDCDRGIPLGTAVRARATATFAAMKPGLTGAGAAYAGEIRVVDIGAPLVWE